MENVQNVQDSVQDRLQLSIRNTLSTGTAWFIVNALILVLITLQFYAIYYEYRRRYYNKCANSKMTI